MRSRTPSTTPGRAKAPSRPPVPGRLAAGRRKERNRSLAATQLPDLAVPAPLQGLVSRRRQASARKSSPRRLQTGCGHAFVAIWPWHKKGGDGHVQQDLWGHGAVLHPLLHDPVTWAQRELRAHVPSASQRATRGHMPDVRAPFADPDTMPAANAGASRATPLYRRTQTGMALQGSCPLHAGAAPRKAFFVLSAFPDNGRKG